LSTANAEQVQVEFIEKVQELFRPHRYKVLVGGRGGLKSWSVARALLLEASSKPYRYLCAREVQNSLSESVHQLLSDQIDLLGMGARFDIQENGIYGKHVHSQFLYTGLAKQTKESIKSYERINRVWVEEAQKVSKRSWDILLPTIRVPGSEIWMTLNPDLETDETYVRFVVSPPPGAVVIHLNFRDNPWLTPELAMEEQATRARSKEDHDNIWEGKPRSASEGAVYQREVSDLVAQGRYGFMPYDPRLKVHTIWDMGWNVCSILLVQRSTDVPSLSPAKPIGQNAAFAIPPGTNTGPLTGTISRKQPIAW
jgi:phage terminase large subunit